MPRGGRPKKTHKGQRRHFTNEEDRELEEEKKRKEKEWRKQKGIASDESEEESGEEGEAGAAPKPKPLYPVSESESGSESGEEKEVKKKGVEGIIDIENPNRVIQKAKKVTEIDVNTAGKTQLSRREREEIAKQQAAAHYRKMHEAGKTEEAQSDLARLAIIRKQREDQAKKRDAEIQVKEAAKADAEKKLLARKKAEKAK